MTKQFDVDFRIQNCDIETLNNFQTIKKSDKSIFIICYTNIS